MSASIEEEYPEIAIAVAVTEKQRLKVMNTVKKVDGFLGRLILTQDG